MTNLQLFIAIIVPMLFNGALIFMIFCLLAMVLDLALTYVFASATTTDREQYIGLSSLGAYGERVVAYLIPGAAAALLALRFRARQRHAAPKVVIQTSEYTQSELLT